MSRLGIGSLIDGKYEVLSRLREGGMGEVYKVRHTHLQELRVIKVLKADLANRTEAAERFLREARLATQVKHPRVATLHDYSRLPDGSFYMVWEHIEGQDVESWLREKGTFPVPIAVELAIQALSGLEAIHRAEIVHRDLSTDNVMITSDRRGRLGAKIIDLGLAKDLRAQALLDSQEGSFGGKLNYCSPEHVGLIEGVRPDHRSDLFSFAIVLYRMVTGDLPFEPVGPNVSLLDRFEREPYSLAERYPELEAPPELDQVLRRALSFDRDQRYPAASSFREALQAFHEPEGRRGESSSTESSADSSENEAVIADLKRRVEVAESQKRRFQAMQARELVEQHIAARHEAMARLALETLLELEPDHPEAEELAAKIDGVSRSEQERASIDERIEAAHTALELGDFAQARVLLTEIAERAPLAAEKLRRRIDLAEEQRQLDDQVAFHRERLDYFLDEDRRDEAELELGLLEALDLPRLVVDLYRRRLAELTRRLAGIDRADELRKLFAKTLREGRFGEAREHALELGRRDSDSPESGEMLLKVDRLEAEARQRSAVTDGVAMVEGLLETGDREQARFALTVLRRMAPGHPECERLSKVLEGE